MDQEAFQGISAKAQKKAVCCRQVRWVGLGSNFPLCCCQLSPENAYDVLCVADMYLLPGLKRLCGRTLAQILDEDNVVSIWRIAKLFQLTRLEDQCTEYMAKIIEKVAEPSPTALTRVPINLNAQRAIDTADLVVALWCVINSCLSDLMCFLKKCSC